MRELPWFVEHSDPESLYRESTYLVLDVETDNEDFGSAVTESNDLVCACWQVVDCKGNVLKKASIFGGIYEYQELLDDIANVAFVVAHNAKFDIQWMRRCGLELRDVLVYDTLLGAWVLDGNRNRPRHLDSLAKRYGLKGKEDIVARLIKSGVSTRDIPPSWLLNYCHQDVETTKQVFLKQQHELSAQHQWHLVHVRNLTCTALADIEFEGLDLDPVEVDKAYTEAVAVRDELGAALANMTGGINLGSPKQLSTFLYDTLRFAEVKDHKGKPIRTGGGERSANAKILEKLVAETEEQKTFLDLYKKYNKQVSLLEKNLEYFKLLCEQRNGKFYGRINQAVVQTGRLASNGIPIIFDGLKKAKSVQMQNIPRSLKRLFWSPEDGWLTVEYDSAQLEFRVAADMGHDKVALKEIEGGVDIHSFTSKVLTEAGEPTDRQNSKQYTFKPLYGGGRGTPAVEAYCEFFKAKYEGISTTQRGWALKCLDKKQFTTPYGMVFYFPDTVMQKSGYITNSTSIYNFPVQGFATGEIIPIALVCFWHRTRDLPVRIMATIHDSAAAKIREDVVEEVTEIAKRAFTTDVYEFLEKVYHYKFRVPLGLGRKVAKHWGDTKEEAKWNVWPDGRIQEAA